MERTGGAHTSNPRLNVPSNPWVKSSEKHPSKPCLVIKTPQKSDKYICPTSSYRELQHKLRKAFQKKIDNMSKDKTACLHPCGFPHSVENCRHTQNQEHQCHRCDRHRVLPKAHSQQMKLPGSSSVPKVVKEIL